MVQSAENIIKEIIKYVVDDIDYELKRLTNSISVVLMGTFDQIEPEGKTFNSETS